MILYSTVNITLYYTVSICKSSVVVVVGLGLKPVGEDTGTADALSSLIIQSKCSILTLERFEFGCFDSHMDVLMCNAQEKSLMSCLCSSRVVPSSVRFCPRLSKRTVRGFLLMTLSSFIPHHHHHHHHWLFVALADVPLDALTVYQTSEHPDLQKNITDYFSQQVYFSCLFVFCITVLWSWHVCVCVSLGCSCERGVLQSIRCEVLCGFGEKTCRFSAGADQGVTVMCRVLSHKTVSSDPQHDRHNLKSFCYSIKVFIVCRLIRTF